ncbi:MAG: HlyC/CorC family transporter [Bacteroidetes bacterium]|nr:HlyC/CorC family transporter [Bacteroidota bacterium]
MTTLLIFLITLLGMALLAGIEMSFYSANRMALEIKKRQAPQAIKRLEPFLESPARLIGTTLVGTQILLVLLALQINDVMQPLWSYSQLESPTLRLIIEILLATLLVLILAEFIPRAYFRSRGENALIRFSGFLQRAHQLLFPIAAAAIDAAEWLLQQLFDVRIREKREPLKRSDLKYLFQTPMPEESDELQAQLIENAQELPKIKVRQCLVPRKEIIGVPRHTSMEEVRQQFIQTQLSKLVVFEKDIDHIVGYVHQLDLFKNPQRLDEIILPIPAIPESMSATRLISQFTRERKSIAWVVDEFGGTAGIVTMEDVLEELFGEIRDEFDTEDLIEKQLGEREFIFSGRLELDYLTDKYDFSFDQDEAETLSGFIINHYDTIPRQKERIIINEFEFEVLQVTDTRIELVRMKWLA